MAIEERAHPAETVPLAAEQVTVEKRAVERGRVRIDVVTREKPVTVREELLSDHVEVERRPRDILVDAMPEVREENGLLIIPVVEEEVVVQRRLRLREEVVIRRTRSLGEYQETVSSRFQEAVVTRTRAGGFSDEGAEGSAASDLQQEVTRDE